LDGLIEFANREHRPRRHTDTPHHLAAARRLNLLGPLIFRHLEPEILVFAAALFLFAVDTEAEPLERFLMPIRRPLVLSRHMSPPYLRELLRIKRHHGLMRILAFPTRPRRILMRGIETLGLLPQTPGLLQRRYALLDEAGRQRRAIPLMGADRLPQQL
jgi:hypothetical protein